MITKLEVCGFKSLHNFTISFNKGLNVLIGPNGAGKSNICHVIGLISSFVDNSIDDFIHSLGGVKTVFTIQNPNPDNCNTKNEIKISCEGLINRNSSKENATLKYVYSFSIALEEELKVKSETLKLFKLNSNKRFKLILETILKKSNEIHVTIKDKENIGPLSNSLAKQIIEKKFVLEPFQNENNENYLQSSIQSLYPIIFYCHLVREDLRNSKVWNIDPHVAKKSSDLTEPYTMLSDGRRLSNRIYNIYKQKNKHLNNVEELLSRVIPRYSKIIPEFSKDELVRTFSLMDKNGIKCPAKGLSDGTIKLIGLLIGVLSQTLSTSIIEEPENYLHPWACQILIEYFRDYFSNRVCIITTHSETILNSIYPHEIVVVTNTDGRTNCSRLSNKRELTEAIKVSGFGCGYHYISGTIGGVPE